MNNSDVKAKEMCIKHLEENGYKDCKIVQSGCDIECTKGGKNTILK